MYIYIYIYMLFPWASKVNIDCHTVTVFQQETETWVAVLDFGGPSTHSCAHTHIKKTLTVLPVVAGISQHVQSDCGCLSRSVC
jgi:hypothetical protein